MKQQTQIIMKLCFYHQTFPKPFSWNSIKVSPIGGTQSAMINIAHCLRLLGADVTICNKTETQVIDGVTYHQIHSYEDFIVYENQSDFDAVIYVGPERDFASNYAPKLKAKKKIMWAQNGWYPHSSYNNYDTIVCVSNSMRLAYAYLPIFDKLCFIHNGVVPDYFPETLLDIEKSPKAIFIGSITQSKGLHHILRAWSQIKALSPKAELLVAGSASIYGIDSLGELGIATKEYEEKFLKPYLIDSDGKMRTDIKFLGAVPQKELGALIASCRVALVNPNWISSGETCCNAALEAQASGTPVVGVNNGSLPEVIRDGATGSIVYQQDDRQYAESVAHLLNDENLSKQLGKAARQFIFKGFTYEIQAKKWFSLLDSLLNDRPIAQNLKSNWYTDPPLISMTKWLARKSKLGLVARLVVDKYRSLRG